MLFVPRQVALASSSSRPPAAMAKEESKKSKAAAKAAAGPDARAVVVASVASFHEAAGFPRAFAALQSEARLEEGTWKSAAVGLEDLVSKFLESSGSAPVTATVGNTEPDEAGNDASVPSAVLEDQAGEKKKKKKKGDTEASEPESKVTEPSAEETPPENVGAETKEKKRKKKKDGSSTEEDKETVKGDHQKVGGKKKKSQKQEVDGDVEARLDKASLAIQNKLEAAEELKEDEGDGATDKTKKKKNGKSEKIVGSVAAEGDDSAKAQTDGDGTVIDDNGKKAKKKRKKSGSEENVPEEGKDHRQGKSAMELEDDEEVKPSSENAAVGKTRKLEAVEESKTPAAENGTTNQTLSNGFAEDDSKENGTMSKPSKRQKTSAEPKSVTPFQRVKMEAVKFADERLQDNSYWAKGGAEIGYGAKAQEVLGQVRGRGFRHEKTKKKRGTYRGGQIDLGTHSIKFENSDDE